MSRSLERLRTFDGRYTVRRSILGSNLEDFAELSTADLIELYKFPVEATKLIIRRGCQMLEGRDGEPL